MKKAMCSSWNASGGSADNQDQLSNFGDQNPPMTPAFELFQPMPHETEMSCPYQSLLKLQINGKNKCPHCFKPLGFGVVCFSALDNWNTLPTMLSSVTIPTVGDIYLEYP